MTERIPLQDMKGIITKAMDGLDLVHSCEWARPPECPCHDLGLERCTQFDGIHGKCQGYPTEIMTPEQHQVTARILIAALRPGSGPGTVDAREAALAVISVVEARLPFPYTLRRDHLRKRLVAASEEYEQQAGLTDPGVPEEDAGSALRCQACAGPLPAGSKAARRTCSAACRVALMRIRRRGGSRCDETSLPAVQHPLTGM